MAETYNPDAYTALLWPEHRRGVGNFGHILELRAEDADGVVALSGRLCPNDQYIYENTRNQGLFFSIEVTEHVAQTGKAYLTGLGVTDSPGKPRHVHDAVFRAGRRMPCPAWPRFLPFPRQSGSFG